MLSNLVHQLTSQKLCCHSNEKLMIRTMHVRVATDLSMSPTQPITRANYGNHVQIIVKSRQSTT